MRDEMIRRLKTYEQLASKLKDGNPIKVLIQDAMESVRRDLARLDASRRGGAPVPVHRNRGRPPQRIRPDAR